MSVPALDTTTIAALVKDATTAPSMHNAQPWRFRFLRDLGTVELYADPERAIPRADPAGRALRIGCGAALFTLRVAAVHAGREPGAATFRDIVGLSPRTYRKEAAATGVPTCFTMAWTRPSA